MVKRVFTCLAALLLMLSAACASALQSNATITPSAEPSVTPLPPHFQAARERLALALGYPLESVILVSAEQVEWRDTCLEAMPEAEGCLDAITPGYRAIFSTPRGEIEVRLDESGTRVFPMISMPGGVPSATPSGLLQSGAKGIILIGPLCPGPVVEGQECPDQPYQGRFTVLDASEVIAAQFETDALGTFQVDLPPGTYTLQPADMSGFMTPQSYQFEVRQGEYTQIEFSLDTGIR